MGQFRELIEGSGLEKAALKAVREFIKKNFTGKLKPNFPGYEFKIGGSVENADPVVQKIFGDLIDLKSRKVGGSEGDNESIAYAGKPGTGIKTIASWKYSNRTDTKIYFEFTDDENPKDAGRF